MSPFYHWPEDNPPGFGGIGKYKNTEFNVSYIYDAPRGQDAIKNLVAAQALAAGKKGETYIGYSASVYFFSMPVEYNKVKKQGRLLKATVEWEANYVFINDEKYRKPLIAFNKNIAPYILKAVYEITNIYQGLPTSVGPMLQIIKTRFPNITITAE